MYVVIVTFNGDRWIGGALDSLRNSRSGCRVIVVDNASKGSTVKIVRKYYPEIDLMCLSDNGGFGRGNKIRIANAIASGAEYVFLLNQDAYVTEDAIGQLVEFLDDHPDFDIATPLHCSPDLSAVDIKTQRYYLCRYAPEYVSDACLDSVKGYELIQGVNAAAWVARSEMSPK